MWLLFSLFHQFSNTAAAVEKSEKSYHTKNAFTILCMNYTHNIVFVPPDYLELMNILYWICARRTKTLYQVYNNGLFIRNKRKMYFCTAYISVCLVLTTSEVLILILIFHILWMLSDLYQIWIKYVCTVQCAY